MERQAEHLAPPARALVSAAERLAEAASDRSCAADLPDALEHVAQALVTLSRGCEGAALALVPVHDPYEPVAQRFARAAGDWPGEPADGPSYERQAQLLAAFDDLASSLRASGRHAARTGGLLQDTMEPAPRAHAAFAAST